MFSSPKDMWSHRTRFVLAEKDVTLDIIDVDGRSLPADLLDLNPYQSLPTLVERDLVLYDSRIIMEYLDERYPHPPLMPIDPITRARFRIAIYRIERDWYTLAADIEQTSDRKRSEEARQTLHDSIMANVEVFRAAPYFQSPDFTLVDATIAPVLWRLPSWGISLNPQQADSVMQYERRVFTRAAFRRSLSWAERAMRV
ncbi:MAG TPA: glutathione S-transferase N-terminal domain-containing protein [Steroidobacteraceae bacterium]|nr:glutathione S-transferase N-terminal domain-containing protein [Steroidobacteraceae bacterium]